MLGRTVVLVKRRGEPQSWPEPYGPFTSDNEAREWIAQAQGAWGFAFLFQTAKLVAPQFEKVPGKT